MTAKISSIHEMVKNAHAANNLEGLMREPDEQLRKEYARRYILPSLQKAKEITCPTTPDEEVTYDQDDYAIVPCAIDIRYVKTLPEFDELDRGSLSVLEFIAHKKGDCNEYALSLLYKSIAKKIVKCSIKSTAGSKYLGIPYTFNPLEIPRCYACSSSMDLLFQLGWDEQNSGFAYGDCGYIYLFYCPNHQDVISFRALG